MSAPFIVPFNFQPVSTTVRTTSYTIPSNKYARVVVNLEGSATFTINGTLALRGTQNSVLGSSLLDTYTFGAGGIALFTNSGNYSPNGDAFNSATDQKTVVAEYWVPTGTVLSGSGTWRMVVTEYNIIS